MNRTGPPPPLQDFAAFVSNLSQEIRELAGVDVPRALNHVVRALGARAHTGSCFIFSFSPDALVIRQVYACPAESAGVSTWQGRKLQEIPGLQAQLERGGLLEALHVDRLAGETPPAPHALQAAGVQAIVGAATRDEGKLCGMIGFAWDHPQPDYPDEIGRLLPIFADIVGRIFTRARYLEEAHPGRQPLDLPPNEPPENLNDPVDQRTQELTQTVRGLEFLLDAAVYLAGVHTPKEIYQFLAAKLSALAPEAIIIISSYEPASQALVIEEVVGDAARLRIFQEILPISLVGIRLPVTPDYLQIDQPYYFVELPGGLEQMSFGMLPPEMTAQLNERLEVGKVFGGRLSWANEVLGDLAVILPRSRALPLPDVVETFLRQVSMALQRNLFEARMRASEERYRSLVEFIPELVMVVVDDRVGYLNPAGAEMLGLPAGEPAGIPAASLVHPASAKSAQERTQAVAIERRVVPLSEESWLRQGGEPILLELTAIPIVYENRYAMLIAARNLTQGRAVERERSEFERRMISILDNAHQMALILDRSGRVTYCNQYLLNVLGWTAAELVGQDWFERCIPPETSTAVGMLFSQIFDQDRFRIHFENEIITRTGELRLIEWTNTLLFDSTGEPVGVASLGDDITEQRRLEVAVRDSEERFRRLAENMPDLVYRFQLRPEFRIEFVNSVVKTVLGYTPEELYTMPDKRRVLLPQGDEAIFQKLFDQPEILPKTIVSRFIRKDGSVIWLEQHNAATRNVEGVVVAVEGVARDITARVLAEQQAARTLARVHALADFAVRLNTYIDLDAIFNEVCTEVARSLESPIVAVRLYDPRSDLLKVAAVYGLPAEVRALMPPLPIATFDVHQRELGLARVDAANYPPAFLAAIQRPEASYLPLLFATMRYEGNLVGTLTLIFPDVTPDVSDEDVIYLKAIAGQAAAAIQKARLFARVQAHAAESDAFMRLSVALRQARTLADLAPVLLKESAHAVHADYAVLLLTLVEEPRIPNIFTWSSERDEITCIQPQDGAEPNLRLGHFNEDYFIDDLAAQAWFGRARQSGSELGRMASGATLPLKTTEGRLGNLVVAYRSPHSFSAEERRLLRSISELAGNALQRASLLEDLERQVEDRNAELAVIYRLGTLGNEAAHPQAVLERSLAELIDVLAADGGFVHIDASACAACAEFAWKGELAPQSIEALRRLSLSQPLLYNVLQRREPVLIPDLAQADHAPEAASEFAQTSYLGASLEIKRQKVGVISLLRRGRPFRVEEIVTAASLVDQVGLAMENAVLRQESERAAALEERQRLARDLHDSVTQTIFSLRMLIEGYHRRLPQATPAELEAWFDDLGEVSTQSLKEARLLLYQLRPEMLEPGNLAIALRHRLDAVEARAGVKAHWKVEGNHLPPGGISQEVFAIAQEALNNALKHSGTGEVWVLLDARMKHLKLEITDDGRGFDPQAPTAGAGLRNMRERAAHLGAELTIDSRVNSGTRLTLELEWKDA